MSIFKKKPPVRLEIDIGISTFKKVTNLMNEAEKDLKIGDSVTFHIGDFSFHLNITRI